MSAGSQGARHTAAIDRRSVLKLAGTTLAARLPLLTRIGTAQAAPQPASKRVIVAGGGIGGLCCAFELMERGHDVTVLEASGRTGGHVKTIHDPLPDNLYADVGAEHFNQPGYDQYWKYVKKFELPFLAYPRRNHMLRRIDGTWYSEEQLQDPAVLEKFGFNERERAFLVEHGWTELPQLYFGPYLDKIRDEYQPFGVGLDALDEMTASELLAKDGASDAGLRFNGLRRGDGTPGERAGEVSALYRIWLQSIMKLRGLPNFQRNCFRLEGGNQRMTDAFATRLGPRVRLGCPLKAIEHGDSGVTVAFEEYGQPRKLTAEFLVSSIPIVLLAKIPITPAWPDWKEYTLKNVVFGSQSRVVLQARTQFWKGELPSINLDTSDPAMYLVYRTADEVPTERTVLMGSGRPDVTPADALAAFSGFYPGKSHTLEAAYVQNWSKDPWALSCERLPYHLGTLKKFWPHMIEPVGRIYFAGCHADNVPWGMDAATRSANRVAQAIHDAS